MGWVESIKGTLNKRASDLDELDKKLTKQENDKAKEFAKLVFEPYLLRKTKDGKKLTCKVEGRDVKLFADEEMIVLISYHRTALWNYYERPQVEYAFKQDVDDMLYNLFNPPTFWSKRKMINLRCYMEIPKMCKQGLNFEILGNYLSSLLEI